MASAFDLKISEDGIAELKFNLQGEKVNKFSPQVLEDLETHVDRLMENRSIKALKITSGKEDVFIAGADLHSFEKVFNDPEAAQNIMELGQRVFSKIEKLPFPTIAVIHGACLGGGVECALSCKYRIVSDHPKTQLGLPEVTIGIFPGWGGTQRLPRLIGLAEGLNMILTGKTVPAIKAYKLHLADAIAAWEFLPEKTDEFIKSILTKEGAAKVLERRKKLSLVNKLLQNNPVGRSFLFKKSKESILERTKGHYPAPLIALGVVEKSYTLPLEEGLKIERQTFIDSIPNGFQISKYLIALFFIQEAAKKDPGLPPGAKPKEVKSAAVLGAGTMGASLAWLLADRHIPTRLKDISWDLIGKGLSTVMGLFKKGLKAKKIKPNELDLRFQLISGTIDYSGFQHVDFVIEAATENLDLKRKIFKEVEDAVSDKAIIVSNTSSLTIDDMCKEMKHPERFAGMHFFNPVHKMPLVEVVAGSKTSPEALATTVDLAKKMGKTPIVVGDCNGFLVNRILTQGSNENMFIFEEGYSMEALNKALLDFGMPMGPFALVDEIGIDVIYKVGKTLEEAYGERMRTPKILQLMYEKNYLGKKNGKGFYIYKGKNSTLNPDISNLLKAVGCPKNTHHPEDILPRSLYGMINEASRCLEEKIIQKPEFLDLCMIMGTGFPPFRGGLLRYADEVGAPTIVSTLKRFEREYGPRFKPSNLLEQMAKENKKFYS